MPPSHLVTVDSVHGDLVRIELVDHLGTITHRWVLVGELFPNPHDAN